MVAILGTLLARMLVQDSRFVSKLEAMMAARQSSRAALHTMAVELRQVSSGGLLAATNSMVRVRVPYAWGVACQGSVAALVPADSMTLASAVTSGFAWRDAAGNYNFVDPGTVAPSGNMAACTADSVRLLAGGQLVQLSPNVVPSGSVLYLFEDVRYRFGTSTLLTGRRALWRRGESGVDDELLAPFSSGSGFGFFVNPNDSALTSPPADLTTVTGLELRLFGESEAIPEGGVVPEDFDLMTRVTFLNR